MKIEKLSQNTEFEQIVRLIEDSRSRALRQVNAELVTLNYQIGQIVSQKVANGVWGEKTVDELAVFIKSKMPELKGFTRRGLYRMKQFYETYLPDSECHQIWLQTQQNKPLPIVSTVVTQLQVEKNQQDTIVSAVPTQFHGQPNSFLSEVLTKISCNSRYAAKDYQPDLSGFPPKAAFSRVRSRRGQDAAISQRAF